MTISGIVVSCRRENLDETKSALNRLPWAQVHYSDSSGRLVATLEASDVDESVQRLRQVQELSSVVMAELAEYCIEDDERSERV